jgi:hypothetical protein
MAKSLLLKVLVDVLGKYVEGLKEENLKVGVWSGKIQMFNLKLKENALDELNLPIKIVRGSLKSLIVKVPWTALESKPVEIYLEGIYALVSPLDLSKFTAEDARKLSRSSKAAQLRQVDTNIAAAMAKPENVQETAKKASYLQQLVTHIVDNLEVNIKNVHIRYEDSVSDPNNTFALGVTLDEISLSTTDETWNIRYVKRNVESPISGVINKLGTVQNCGIYWNPKAIKSSEKAYDLWEEYMFNTIYKLSTSNPLSEFVYILDPQNKLTVKLTHSEKATESTPNVDVLIESSTIALNFDRAHYRQIMLVTSSFDELERRKFWALQRPLLRPNVDPRAWWFYAYQLVRGRDISFSNKVKMMTLCMKSKNKYIGLVKLLKIKEAKSPPEKLDAADEAALNSIEEVLPLCALTVFREEAVRLAITEMEFQKAVVARPLSIKPVKQEEKKSATEEKKASFFSGWFSSSKKSPVESAPKKVATKEPSSPTPSEEDDVALMQNVESKIRKMEEESQTAVNSSFGLRLRLVSSTKLNVTYEKVPLLNVSMNLGAAVEMRFTNILIHCDFGNVFVKDLFSQKPYNRDIIQMLPDHGSSNKLIGGQQNFPSQFGFDLSIIQEKVKVKVSSLPLLFTWNEECIKKIVDFFKIDDLNPSGYDGSVADYNQSNVKLAKTNTQAFVEVEIHVYAPKVLIPENPKYEERCLLLDAGVLSMTGRIDSAGMNWNLGLNRINLALPSTKVEALEKDKSPDAYLIKPFDVSLKIQDIDKTAADLSLDGLISPSIRAEFDAEKIIRLIQAVLMVIGTFTDDTSEKAQVPKSIKAEPRRGSVMKLDSHNPPKENRRGSIMPGSSMVTTTTNKQTNPLKIHFDLAGLECVLKISDNHYATLKFTDLNFSFLDRPHDTLLDFTMNSLELTDSNRYPGFEHVISAKSKSQTSAKDLVHIQYFIIKDKRSPVFHGFQNEIEIDFADIDAFIDPFTTNTYQVLMKDLIENYKVMFRQTKVIPVSVDVPTIEFDQTVKSPNELSGMRLKFVLNAVGVHLLDQVKPSSPELEAAFSFRVKRLTADILQQELVSGNLSLSTVELLDTRKRSASLFYKTLVNNVQKIDVAVPNSRNHLLDLDFHQNSDNTTVVEIKVRDLTTTISIDVIMDLVDLLLANINSVMKVLDQIKFDEVEAPKITTVRRASVVDYIDHEETLSSVMVNVAISNPYLVLLEDPAKEHSKSIAATCEIVVQYVQEQKNTIAFSQESKDVIHVSLQQAAIFVLLDNNSLSKISRRIIEPTAMQFHMNSTVVNGINVMMDMSISAEDIFMRASLNDIVLTSAIVNRLALQSDKGFSEMEDAAVYVVKEKSSLTGQSASSKKEQITAASGVTLNKIRISLSKAQIVLINDYNGQSSPLVRVEANDAHINLHGALIDLAGEGSVLFEGDYYNSDLALWEPIFEKWQPTFKYSQALGGKELSITYIGFVQINVTGMLIKCISNAVNLISRIGEEGIYCSRGESLPLTIKNQLGVSVELYDASTKKMLLLLDNDSLGKVPALSQESSQSRIAREKEFLRQFDLKFVGGIAESFSELKELRLDIHKPKIYQILNSRPTVQRASSSYAPVVEEVYQYQRFNLLKNSWEGPWSNVGDPEEWSDGLGKAAQHPSKVTCPPGWDWLEPEWKPDLNGKIGKEIDNEGWEYGLHFNNFGLNTKRRVQQPADCVRRRRWIRTRYVRQEKSKTAENFSGRMVWQIISNPDESKMIMLRSTKIVENRFSMGIEIGLETTFTNQMCGKSFKVYPNSEGSFPLLYSEESGIRIKLQGFGCAWSEPVPLIAGKAAHSANQQDVRTYRCRCNDDRSVSLCVSTIEKDGILRIIVSPLLEVTNYLPCDIQYKSQGMHEDITILSGGKSSAIFFEDNVDLLHFFRLGFYTASIPLKFPQKGSQSEEPLNFFSTDKSSALGLRLSLETYVNGTKLICIYSSMLIIDRTDLSAMISNNSMKDSSSKSVDWNRRTFVKQKSSKDNQITVDNESWIVGKNGLTLFSPSENRIQMSFCDGSAVLSDVAVDSLSSSKSNLDAVDTGKMKCYHVSLKSEPYSVAADLSNVVTLMPTFHIVNYTSQTLYLCQKGVDPIQGGYTEIPSKSTTPWHGLCGKRETNLFLKTETSDWSLGTININDIGTSSVMLLSLDFHNGNQFVVLNVEVKLSDPSEFSYITVIIWESKIWRDPLTLKVLREGTVSLSVKNNSNVPIILRQRKVSIQERLSTLNRKSRDMDANRWALVVPPNDWKALGLIDPEEDDNFDVSVGISLSETIGEPVVVKFSKVGFSAVSTVSKDTRIRIQVKSSPSGKILIVQNDDSFSPVVSSSSQRSYSALRQNDFVVKVLLPTICLSVVADRPVRRELFALTLTSLDVEIRQVEETNEEDAATLFQFKLGDIQLDNYSESVVYPVLLRTDVVALSEDRKEGQVPLQFIECSLVLEHPSDQSAPIIRYVACRVLELFVSVDSASVLIAASDLLSYVSFAEESDDQFELRSSELFNSHLVKSLEKNKLYDVSYQYKSSQGQKLFIEALVIHPMKFTLDFYPNHFPRHKRELPKALRWLTMLETVTSVENFHIRIKSFITENIMETPAALGVRIGNKIGRDIQSNLLQIAGNLVGSLNLIGNPAGLYKNIGGGVQDFFYEVRSDELYFLLLF